MSNEKESTKIRNFIRIGVFTALWIVVSWIFACTMAFIPAVLLILPCILAIVGGAILEVMQSKLTIKCGIAIASFLFGICLVTMMPKGMMFFCTFGGGIIGSIIYDTIGKKSDIAKAIGVTFPMLGLALGEYIPFCFMKDAFYLQYADRSTGGVRESVINMMSNPLALLLGVITVILGIVGYFWGRKIAAKRK